MNTHHVYWFILSKLTRDATELNQTSFTVSSKFVLHLLSIWVKIKKKSHTGLVSDINIVGRFFFPGRKEKLLFISCIFPECA